MIVEFSIVNPNLFPVPAHKDRGICFQMTLAEIDVVINFSTRIPHCSQFTNFCALE